MGSRWSSALPFGGARFSQTNLKNRVLRQLWISGEQWKFFWKSVPNIARGILPLKKWCIVIWNFEVNWTSHISPGHHPNPPHPHFPASGLQFCSIILINLVKETVYESSGKFSLFHNEGHNFLQAAIRFLKRHGEYKSLPQACSLCLAYHSAQAYWSVEGMNAKVLDKQIALIYTHGENGQFHFS